MASKRDLTKFLKDLSKEELIKEVEKLYQKFKEVKSYYDIELGGDTSDIVRQVKEKIKKEYMPERGYGKARASVVKKLIDDFAKISIYPSDLIDVNLYRVEMGVAFTDAYGDIDEAFYTSAVSAFERTMKLIDKHQLHKDFQLRCKELLNNTRDMGWGFYDDLSFYYGMYFQVQENQ